MFNLSPWMECCNYHAKRHLPPNLPLLFYTNRIERLMVAYFLIVLLIYIAVYKSLMKLRPPPCNNYYLSLKGCLWPDCKYSHSHKLNDYQLSAMRYYLKQTPCDSWKSSRTCANGDQCDRGHDCLYNVNGMCRKSGTKCALSHPIERTVISLGTPM